MAASEETGRKQARKWKDEEVNTLIDLLEQQTCLWDCCAKEYHLKDKRDMAYEALNKQLNIPISDIKYSQKVFMCHSHHLPVTRGVFNPQLLYDVVKISLLFPSCLLYTSPSPRD